MTRKKAEARTEGQNFKSFIEPMTLDATKAIDQLPRLEQAYFLRDDVLGIAGDLIGKLLVTKVDGELCAGRIVETEAYKAPEDKASHAWNNRRTARTEIMFGEGGHAYVYLCYGMHHLFNVVTGPAGQAHAVLVRALEPVANVECMLRRRNMRDVQKRLTAGPAVLTKAMGITTADNGTCLFDPDSHIWLADDGFTVETTAVERSPRIGVDYAGECAAWDWRFTLKNSKWISK
jgi:DNA-3-methyladenine glycosylase